MADRQRAKSESPGRVDDQRLPTSQVGHPKCRRLDQDSTFTLTLFRMNISEAHLIKQIRNYRLVTLFRNGGVPKLTTILESIQVDLMWKLGGDHENKQ